MAGDIRWDNTTDPTEYVISIGQERYYTSIGDIYQVLDGSGKGVVTDERGFDVGSIFRSEGRLTYRMTIGYRHFVIRRECLRRVSRGNQWAAEIREPCCSLPGQKTILAEGV